MGENQHLDIGAVMEEDAYWFETIDTSCPFCENGKADDIECEKCSGEGEYECPQTLPDGQHDPTCDNPDCEDGFIGCDDCDGSGTVEADGSCERCDGAGNFEILWNTAFQIPYLKDGLSFGKARRLAWERGWLLFEYESEKWIASGSCGYDFTWQKAACALELCGDLPIYYADQLSSGGDVFVDSSEGKQALLTAAVEALFWRVKRDQRQIEEFEAAFKKNAFEDTMKLEASHATPVEDSKKDAFEARMKLEASHSTPVED